MNKHIKTIKSFKDRTPVVFNETYQELKQALWHLLKFFQIILMTHLYIATWFISLILLIVALPLMTWLRLYMERKVEEDFKKQREAFFKRNNPIDN